jgi:hypothetical protein
MQVSAISTPRDPEWRWRITDYAGAMVEESRESFGSIAEAIAAGTKHLISLEVIDRSELARPPWTASGSSRLKGS